MNTITIALREKHPAIEYLNQNMNASRAVRNTANFLIRNVSSALNKEPSERTASERLVLTKVYIALIHANRLRYEAFKKKRKKYEDELSKLEEMPDGEEKTEALKNLKEPVLKLFNIPDKKHSFLSYGQIDAILKYTEDISYYSCTSQVNQQAIKKTCLAWKGFFESLKSYKTNPDVFKAAPKRPGYIRTAKTTAAFTSGVCKLEKQGQDITLKLAKYGKINLGKIPCQGRLVRMEAVPDGKGCRLHLTFDNGKENQTVEIPENPERIMAIDPGVSNFAACVTNTGSRPFIIDGRKIKSFNQYFNKRRAQLISKLTQGKKPTKKFSRTSKKLEAISRKRRNRLRDFFYKAAHAICRKAGEEKIELIVYGHNIGQKQEINIGKANNQNFVQIPYMNFFNILQWVAAKYGIAVVLQEESYTSKADFLAGDNIPTYKKGNEEKYKFSGRRVRRGLYKSGTGKILNADINGAANILRKNKADAFLKTDTSALLSVSIIRYSDIYPKKKAA